MKLSMTLAIALLAFASTSQAQMSAEVKMPAASQPAAGRQPSSPKAWFSKWTRRPASSP